MVNILVVDDDEGVRKCLSEILEEAGYVVKCVENGQQAILASHEDFFNVALIDIQLPDMGGIELLGKLKKTEPEIIKIIITGHASLNNSIEALNRGADSYVLKPFDPEKLLALIEMHLKKQREKVVFDEKKVAEYIETRDYWMSSVKVPNRK